MRRAILRCASASPYHSVQPCRSTVSSAAALRVTSSSAARASKRGDLAVVAEACLDVITGQRPEAIRAELLAAEATHYATIDRGPGQLPRLRRGVGEAHAARGQIADEAPRETVARPGGILQRVQQNAGDIRVAALMKQRRTVLAAFDHQDPRAHRADELGGALQIVLTREQTRQIGRAHV